MSDPGVTKGGSFQGTSTGDRNFLFSNLIPRTNYVIDIRAVHSDFAASPPVFISGVPVEIMAETAVPPGTSF